MTAVELDNILTKNLEACRVYVGYSKEPRVVTVVQIQRHIH